MQTTLSAHRGRTVFMQWLHILQVGLQRLEISARDIFSGQNKPETNAPFARKRLGRLREESSAGIALLFDHGMDGC